MYDCSFCGREVPEVSDLSPGDRDIEEVAKELYKVLSCQLDCVDITNKDL